MIVRQYAEVWRSKFGCKCRFLGLMPCDDFYADYVFQIKIFLCSTLKITIGYQAILNFVEVEVFWFKLKFDHRFLLFLDTIAYLAILSIIKRDNRLLDGYFEKLKRFPCVNMHQFLTQIPNSGRKISLKKVPSSWNFCGVIYAIVGWCYELMNVQIKIRGPCQRSEEL